MPMDAENVICSLAVSRDGRWIVSGTESGLVTVWNAESGEKVTEFTGHSDWVHAVDVSPGGTRIATGSNDGTACVWSLSTGQRLFSSWDHNGWVVAVKISPDGCLIATAASNSVRVYNGENDCPLVDVPIQVKKPLAWASDAKRLFALSYGHIHCLDASTGTTLSKWPIHNTQDAECIALASNGTFITASTSSSVSFWDTTTREQIGSVIKFTRRVWCIVISRNNDLAVGGDSRPSQSLRYPSLILLRHRKCTFMKS